MGKSGPFRAVSPVPLITGSPETFFDGALICADARVGRRRSRRGMIRFGRDHRHYDRELPRRVTSDKAGRHRISGLQDDRVTGSQGDRITGSAEEYRDHPSAMSNVENSTRSSVFVCNHFVWTD